MIRHIRAATLFAVLAVCLSSIPPAAALCPNVELKAPPPETIVDWYAMVIEPTRAYAGFPVTPRPAKNVIEAMVDSLDSFHRRSILDPLYFEPLVRRLVAAHANVGDFKGLDTRTAENLYRGDTGGAVDFGALCIDTRRARFPDDTFAITLTGVNNYNCTHVTLRGLVFSNILINGAANGECRADLPYFRMLFMPVALSGTNTVTFLCTKDAGGCAGR